MINPLDFHKRKNRIWTTFHFESNQVWGLVRSHETWKEMKTIYLKQHYIMNLDKIYTNGYVKHDHMVNCSQLWAFGTRSEYTGKYSLADFARDYDMEL